MKLKILFAINFLLLSFLVSLLVLFPYVYTFIIVLAALTIGGFNPSGVQELITSLLSNILFFGPIVLLGYVGYKIGKNKEDKIVDKDTLDMVNIKYLILTMLVFAITAVVSFINISSNGFILWGIR